MTRPHAIALLGFSPEERSSFEAFFRMAARRAKGFDLLNDAANCDLVLANADDSSVMARLLERPPAVPVLLIGEDDAGTGWPIEPQPVKLMNVLTRIDYLLSPRAMESPKARAQMAATVPAPLEMAAAPAQESDDGLLIVDDSDTALHFMRTLLKRVGFGADTARSAEEALQKLGGRSYRIIFMDVMLEGMDGYQACKLIKQGKYESGKPPVVVMLTSKAGTIDKIKGSVAGCDAYLVKPTDERSLLKVLAKYDEQIHRSFGPTRLGSVPGKPAS
ncbi:MAG: response regulator [Comamonadaceae bacterium]|nr:MAG: response regulator [Comamonadaceae bacterium]